ncbi:hypothetical protein RJ641_019435 [Dillenia turbinata]|uniref:Protein NUCLEAR FUSION DEFECTIVE 6, chloroplastic/mitochondrial-like n=1 Tax=Dillenia turbinata TaxID=194707 RepID=A0AAN8YVF1_9MAGN
MASFCRSAVMGCARSVAARAQTVAPKTYSSRPISSSAFVSSSSSSTRTSLDKASKVVSVLGCMESLMPYHTAVANARLKSIIAVDSSCWSWPSQGLFLSL